MGLSVCTNYLRRTAMTSLGQDVFVEGRQMVKLSPKLAGQLLSASIEPLIDKHLVLQDL